MATKRCILLSSLTIICHQSIAFLSPSCCSQVKGRRSFLLPTAARNNRCSTRTGHRLLEHKYDQHQWCYRKSHTLSLFASTNDDDAGDEEGLNLAAQFSELLKQKGINANIDGIDDDDDDDEEDDDDAMRDIPRSEINVFSGRDDKGVGKLAGNVTFTNKELYDSLKERCLESPAAFAKLTRGDDDDNDDNDDETGAVDVGGVYKPVDVSPDSDLTAGEVVTTILNALLHNDEPEENHGVRVLFGYSSPASILKSEDKAPTVEEYADFLKTSEYKVLLEHSSVIIDKAEYSYDGKKAFYNVRLKTGSSGRNFTTVNFILSTKGHEDEDSWLIDSVLIRADGMGRSRRRR
eukprot:CAMPEP_0172490236 /NCGR_PEP_ID=MMETSP1066-20121228/20572_1 /TAXON_ID=671091 /ORGANISM="Coscinodiscus wailesii, Strain CCMP2513" /LENGTH=348 /DNA_ID=CAMNT_0013258597 /DNA_START=129 /DNA_END=1175 /DNA_ORIENTATION=-